MGSAVALQESTAAATSGRSGWWPGPAHPTTSAFEPRSPAISATVLTRNSARWLPAVLAGLAWTDEVVILDTGSTDGTTGIAESFANVKVHRLASGFPGFGRAHQIAVELARHDWILSIDSDEIVTPDLAREIRQLRLDPGTVYAIEFHNHYAGRRITTCGWSPEWHERLFNRRTTNFCASEVHERVQTKNHPLVRLRYPIHHHSYANTDDFLRKLPVYARLFAHQNSGRRRTGPVRAVMRSGWAFGKSYILQRGFLQGTDGLVISAYKSQTVFWKYVMLHEANRRQGS